MIPRYAVLALLIAGAALAGCGRRGELDRPGPLVGKGYTPSAEQTTREAAARHAKEEGEKVGDPRAPQSVDEVRNQPLPKPPATPSPPEVEPSPPASSTPQ